MGDQDQDREREAFTLRTGITPGDLRRLGRVPLFTGILPDDMRKLLSSSSIRHYPNHTTLFMQGESADRFYVAMDGWVKLYRLCEDGQEVVVSVISPGESFAEAAIFDSQTYPVNAAVITETRLLVIHADSLLRHLRDSSDLAMNMLGSMSRFLRCSITLLHQLSSMSSTERLADFLIGLTEAREGEAMITLPLDKSLIAARLGMQPETFSRALGKLKSVGVSNNGHEIFIKDVAVLKDNIKNSAGKCP